MQNILGENVLPIEILLVEDSPGDVLLTREALRDAKIRLNLQVAVDGEEAVALLRREGKYATAPRPDLVLLDLNLPKKDGREVLKEIKADSYQLHANCFVTKPVDLDQFLTVVKSIDNFWLTVVKLPDDPL